MYLSFLVKWNFCHVTWKKGFSSFPYTNLTSVIKLSVVSVTSKGDDCIDVLVLVGVMSGSAVDCMSVFGGCMSGVVDGMVCGDAAVEGGMCDVDGMSVDIDI